MRWWWSVCVLGQRRCYAGHGTAAWTIRRSFKSCTRYRGLWRHGWPAIEGSKLLFCCTRDDQEPRNPDHEPPYRCVGSMYDDHMTGQYYYYYNWRANEWKGRDCMHSSVCIHSGIRVRRNRIGLIRRNEKAVLLLLTASKVASTMLYPFYLFPSIVSGWLV